MKKLCVLFVCTMSSMSFAASGVSVKGGGSGVVIGNTVALLDLVENGVDRSPYFGSKSCGTSFTFSPIETLAPESSPVHSLLCRKLLDTAKLDPVLATAFLKTIANLTWTFSDQALKVIDADPIIEVDTVQLAVRNGNRVIVNRPFFDRMNAANQTALIVHEVAAALVSTEISAPHPVRILVGNLFRSSYYKRTTNEILNDLRYFPSRRKMRDRVPGWIHLDLPETSIESDFTFLNNRGVDAYPSLSALWTDASNTNRELEALYVTEKTADRVGEILRYCDEPQPKKRLVNLTVTYISPNVLARVELEDGSPTDRYDFDNGLEVFKILFFDPLPQVEEACTPEIRSSLKQVDAWLAGFKPVPLRPVYGCPGPGSESCVR